MLSLFFDPQRDGRRSFVILTTQRSGSTFFRSWLNNHPNVRCHSEVFLDIYPAADGFAVYCSKNKIRGLLYSCFAKKRRWSQSRYNFLLAGMINQYLFELFTNLSFSAPWSEMCNTDWTEYKPRTYPDHKNVVGFQLMYSQLFQYKYLQNWLKKINIPVIHLFRKNTLNLIISTERAKQTGDWHFNNRKDKHTIALDPKRIVEKIKKAEAIRQNVMQQVNNPCLEITYEDFFSNRSEVQNEIVHFLGLKNEDVQEPYSFKKIIKGRLAGNIENYDEINIALAGSPYYHYLSEK